MNTSRIAIVAFGAGALALAAACGPTVSKSSAPPPPKSPPASTPAAPSSSAASTTSGPVGTSFTVTTQNSNGDNVSYDVTLVTLDQHAGLGQYETLNNPADHMAAARFTIKGVTGQESDDSNSDATAIGTDTTVYQPSFNSVTDGGNFNSGQFSVAPGESASGWVSFEVPPGQLVASVQWSPDAGLGDSHATWTVGK